MATGGGYEVDDPGELVEFVGADVGTVREAEIDLWRRNKRLACISEISEDFDPRGSVPFLSGSSGTIM